MHHQKQASCFRCNCAAVIAAFAATAVQAVPIALTNTGCWLDTVGANSIGLAGGGSVAGISTALFVMAISGAANASSPLLNWTIPDAALTGDVDLIQLAFYNDDTNLEIGTRVTLPGTATSFQFGSALPLHLALVVNVGLVDLFDDGSASAAGNIQRESRAFVDDTTAVPEPASLDLVMLGAGALAVRARRTRLQAAPG